MLKRPDVKTENILRLADYIERLPPEKLDMREWCGTACCIAGHADTLFGLNVRWGHCDLAVEETLGLSANQAARLFFPFAYLPWGRNWKDITPDVAARVLRHLAVTGEVDWSIVQPNDCIEFLLKTALSKQEG